MAIQSGTFVWHELTAADPAASSTFYRAVMGWEGRDAGMPGMSYELMVAGERQVAGVMAVSPGAGACWTGYVGVADVDASAAQVTALGGVVHRAPGDIPGVGRFAVVADPQGAVFCLFAGAGEAPPPVAADTPGHGGWAELHAGDWRSVWPFYEALFGWAVQRDVDMGPHGTYRVFGAGAEAVGGMMTDPKGAARWLYYFNVDGIDDAVSRVTGAGGTVTNGPMEVPGGSLVAQCADPAGVAFAIVGRSRRAAG